MNRSQMTLQTLSSGPEFQLVSRAQPRYIREASTFAAATEALHSAAASRADGDEEDGPDMFDDLPDDQPPHVIKDVPLHAGGDDLNDEEDFEPIPQLGKQKSDNSAASASSNASDESSSAYAALYSSLRGNLNGGGGELLAPESTSSSSGSAGVGDDLRNRTETEHERDDIHQSIRGLVDKEKGRECCCCFKMPSGDAWRKLPVRVAARRKSMFSKEQQRLKHLRWMAKSVVDKTIESIIGNPVSSTGFVTFTSLTAASIACNSSV